MGGVLYLDSLVELPGIRKTSCLLRDPQRVFREVRECFWILGQYDEGAPDFDMGAVVAARGGANEFGDGDASEPEFVEGVRRGESVVAVGRSRVGLVRRVGFVHGLLDAWDLPLLSGDVRRMRWTLMGALIHLDLLIH